jgi:alpha-D-xyloside xylohydrolase
LKAIRMWTILEQQASFAIFSQGNETLRVEATRSGCFRITQTREKAFVLQNEPIVLHPEPECTLQVTETGDSYTVSTESLRLSLGRSTGAITYFNADGALLLREPEHDGRLLRDIDVVRYHYSSNAKLSQRQSVDGARVIAQGEPYVDRKGFATRLSFVFQEGEALFGLGQHEQRVLNHRGNHQYLYQHNLKISCPVLVSSCGWGLLMNTCAFVTFHDDAFGSYLAVDTAEELDYFFFSANTLDASVAVLRSLTGNAPLPPKWAFGYLQSKERYSTQQELIDIAVEYRRRQIPLDGVVQDWLSWPEGLWGQKSADIARYPDLQAATDTLHQMGCHLMWSIWPNMTGDGSDRLAFEAHNQLLGNRSTYNALSPQARARYWQQMNEGLYQYGVDSWWCDCTEPFESDWNGETEMTAEERMAVNVSEAKKYIDPAMINAYSLYHTQGIYEGQRKTDESKRVFILSRSAYPGQQRYGTFVWSGDTSATWKQLGDWIPNALNLCVTGIPYWTQDVGAFFVKRWQQWFGRGEYEQGVDDPDYRELYLRWFQASAFLPMLRAHGTDTPREVWRFGEPGDAIYDGLLNMIELRMRLLPYLYSIAAEVTYHNGTMLRMLAFDFMQDQTAIEIKDEYLLGHALLICPVIEKGARSRMVYLPKGTTWYDFYTEQSYLGGQWLKAEAPLNRIPLFVRMGSILPLGPVKQYAAQANDTPLILRVYSGADGTFSLYDDAGDSYAYEKGEFGWLHLRWDDQKQELTRTLEGQERFLPAKTKLEVIKPKDAGCKS